MSYFNLGVYWPADRPLSLRNYADATRAFLLMLRDMHPAFRSLEWVGDRPNAAVKLLPDLSNLDELIYRRAGSDEHIYQKANADGTPSWDSVCMFGYYMDYGTGRSANAGGLSLSISAGHDGIRTPNSVCIGFPLQGDERFPHREFYELSFLKKLFSQMIAFWKPADGLLTSNVFSNVVADEGLPYVGWLTYLGDPRAAALRNCAALQGLTFEATSDGGTLISLGTDIISPDNPAQLEKARRLRAVLIAEKIV